MDIDFGFRTAALSVIEVDANALTALLGGGGFKPVRLRKLAAPRVFALGRFFLGDAFVFCESHLSQVNEAAVQFVAGHDGKKQLGTKIISF
jgi:hypothetical protein